MSKPVPVVSEINEAYFAGSAQGELRLRVCQRCQARFRFAYHWCPSCWSQELGSTVASGRGTVTTFTIVYQSPYPAFDDVVPYVLALVELEEGVRLMTNIVGCAPEAVRIGMPVKVTFEQRENVALPMFTPA
jgi:uncharacterized OB-fold protein